MIPLKIASTWLAYNTLFFATLNCRGSFGMLKVHHSLVYTRKDLVLDDGFVLLPVFSVLLGALFLVS